MSATRDEVLRAMAEAVDSGVQQALRDYGISDEVIGADVERFAASLTTASYALASAEQAGWVLVPKRLPCPECSGEGYTALLYGGEEVQCEQCRGSGEIDVWTAMLNAAPKVTS